MTIAADPHLWLEDVAGASALAWVRERNAETRRVLEAEPGFDAMRARIRGILDSRQQIPQVVRRGAALYNFWRDAEHPRGLWRRTTLAEYRQPEPAWELLLDLDALGAAEQENWVWGGAECLGAEVRRCLLKLSRGGADATVLREYDLDTKSFVDGGFTLPEAKLRATWIDIDTVYVGTDFGPGSMTESGYPRVIKRWRRGQALADAVTVFEVGAGDLSAWAAVDHTPGFERTTFGRQIDFYDDQVSLLVGSGLQPLTKPDDASLDFWRDRVLLSLRSDWPQGGQVWPSGSLLVADAEAFIAGRPQFQALFTPSATRSLAGVATTRTRVVLDILDNVASRIETLSPQDGGWARREAQAPFPGTLAVEALHDPLVREDPLAEALLVHYTDFLTPDSLLLAPAGGDERETLKSRPSFFDAEGMRVEQRFARSQDGTRVPYFVVWPKGLAPGAGAPTLLYGYGGFEVSMQPAYSGTIGNCWLARGGVYVVANIRGGGEFGPAWHQAAILADKQRSYDDFVAVAEDLVASRITTPAQLGIEGGSNGGLLVGAVMVQRPELFGAVVCQVPLLDMKRYHRLLAGASWMAEYGDPDRAPDWAWIARYSPYHNVSAEARMPPVLFTTSTRDDRVHPGHARKMAARMREQGHAVLYYENIEGGHGGAADNAQRADMQALELSFLWRQLGGLGGHAMIAWIDDATPLPAPCDAGDPDAPGLVAIGGSLTPQRLEEAYRKGIFPWFSAGQPVLWWSPDPRMVLPLDGFVLSRSLRKTLRRFLRTPGCEFRFDSAFRAVMQACADAPREGQDGTWIVPAMVDAYCDWHRAGRTHSVETWVDGELIGGLYFIAIGRMVFGESMFARRSDASKLALAALVAACRAHGVRWIDCQQHTRHLASFGAHEVPRPAFEHHLSLTLGEPEIADWSYDASHWAHLDGVAPGSGTSHP